MNSLETLISNYPIDLTLRPATFDLWHVCLAGTVAVLMGIVILLLSALLISRSRNKKKMAATLQQYSRPEHIQPVEPVVKIVEKIVEVERIVQAPVPEPVVLKESTPDAALQVLSLLQKEARFLDFIKEDITAYNDADIGVAARVVHEGCNKAISEHFSLAPVRTEQEGSRITLAADFNAGEVRLTGNIVGAAPFTGTLVHKGWQVTDIRLPKLTQGYNPNIVAAAELEL